MTWTEWKKVPGLDFTETIAERKYRKRGGGVFRLSFNRPERMNPMTDKGWEEVCLAMDYVNHADDIGVVVFAGMGDHFGIGGDIQWEAEGGLHHFWKVPPFDDSIRSSLKPTIAAVHGYCIGGHNHLAYHCDFTIAAENAIFGQFGPKIGSPIHGELVSSLVHVVGMKRAKEMWMLCRQYTAHQMLEWGLVNRVVPLPKLHDEVDQWCDELLDIIPECMGLIKQSFEGVGIALRGENGRLMTMIAPKFFESPNIMEAVNAFMEKRKPDFWKKK
ncbi:MAG: enoyl-CoA hydratase/isomerase family protein [Deltaproteobacteria bacterium]|nr:enoyl-CoA hydratase/isomerase family protein [Deltaproteobacteria bacterium]MBW1951329.1 enoyl-CoA hydratase/isomerase family protein [Deltaproteobacteria bacterium]